MAAGLMSFTTPDVTRSSGEDHTSQMPAPNQSMAEISASAKACLDVFTTCHTLRAQSRTLDPGVTHALWDQYERMKLWASNIGVFAELHASLDYRIREHDDLKRTLVGHLDIIENRLESRRHSRLAPSMTSSADL